MAKRKASRRAQPEKINKSSLIREAMKHGNKQPKEIANYVQSQHGVTLTTAYISSIKHSTSKRAIARPSSRVAHELGGTATLVDQAREQRNTLGATVAFIKLVGGLEQARAALDICDEIKQLP